MTKTIQANLSAVLPKCCAKCGGVRFEVVEDGLQCIYDGWICYLIDELIEAIRREGLDKMKTVCHDRG